MDKMTVVAILQLIFIVALLLLYHFSREVGRIATERRKELTRDFGVRYGFGVVFSGCLAVSAVGCLTLYLL